MSSAAIVTDTVRYGNEQNGDTHHRLSIDGAEITVSIAVFERRTVNVNITLPNGARLHNAGGKGYGVAVGDTSDTHTSVAHWAAVARKYHWD